MVAGVAAPAQAATSVTITTPVPTFTENTASPAFSANLVSTSNITGTVSIDVTKSDFSARWTFNSVLLSSCPTTSESATSTLSDCGITVTSNNSGTYTGLTVYNMNNILMFTFAGTVGLTDATFDFASSTYSSVRSSGNYTLSILASTPATAAVTVVPGGATIQFMPNGASGAPTSQTASGTVALTANPYTRSGYTFAGWATSSTGSVVYANGANYNFSSPTTLYAKWTANSSGGGSGSSSGTSNTETLANTGINSATGISLLAGGLSLALVGTEMFMIARRKRSN